MRSLPKPGDNPTDVFVTCISRAKDADLKARLTSIQEHVTAVADAYEAAAAAATLDGFPTATGVGGAVSTGEMVDVYKKRMAKKDAPGRPLYDRLMAAPRHGRCPLCGQRTVSTLDHHFPKSLYPGLAVNPLNLVPACADCNKEKGEFAPSAPHEQTLHPYFDDVDGETWLFAEVLERTRPTMRFVVRPPATWLPQTAQRIAHHFQLFRLGELYGSHAGEELVNIRYGLSTLFAAAGAQAVRVHLDAQAISFLKARRNTWQAAMYRALVDCDWYCEGGFELAAESAVEPM